MSLFNIQEYRRAQALVKDLEKIIKILKLTETSLKAYEYYRPVQHILTAIALERPMLEVHLEHNKITVDLKGQKK
jgi:hypothetical protein